MSPSSTSLPIRTFTDHGARRLQQRGISTADVERVVRYGKPLHKHGAVRYYLDQTGRRRLQDVEGDSVMRQAANKLDIFVVVSRSGALVTAGYRDGRMRH